MPRRVGPMDFLLHLALTFSPQARALSKIQQDIIAENGSTLDDARRVNREFTWLHAFFKYWFTRFPRLRRWGESRRQHEDVLLFERKVSFWSASTLLRTQPDPREYTQFLIASPSITGRRG